MAEAFTIAHSDRHIRVHCPRNQDWRHWARDLRGRWLPEEKCWSFLASDEARVRDALGKVFGYPPAEKPSIDAAQTTAQQLVLMRERLLDPLVPLTHETVDELIRLLDKAAAMISAQGGK